MNAIDTPAAAGIAGDVPDRRDWLRLVGGMMFAAGALVLLIRKGSDWSDWAVFAALLIPAAILIGMAVLGRAQWGLTGWHTAFLVFGTLLLLGALVQLVNALDGNPRADLNLLWTFGVTGAVAVGTSIALRASFQMLLGAALLIVSWLALWDKVLSNPSGDTVRWLLIVLAAIYLVVAVMLSRARRPQSSDLVTVSGATAVFAAALSFAAAAASFSDSLGSSVGSDVPKPGQGWNVFLLVVSLLLIAYASRSPTRGPGYVGAVGLAAFIVLTGTDLVSRIKGEEGGGVVGWPLVLLIGGVAALVLSFVLRPGSLGGSGGPGAPGTGGPGVGAYGQPGVTQAGAPVVGQPGAPAQPGLLYTYPSPRDTR
jgi:hypothetical protein